MNTARNGKWFKEDWNKTIICQTASSEKDIIPFISYKIFCIFCMSTVMVICIAIYMCRLYAHISSFEWSTARFMVGTSVVLILDAYRQTGDVVGSVCTFSKLSGIGQSRVLTTAVASQVFVDHNAQNTITSNIKLWQLFKPTFYP